MKLRHMFIISAIFLSGCVGLFVGTYGTFEVPQNAHLPEKGSRPDPNLYSPSVAYSRGRLIEFLGEPDATRNYKACEILVYRDGWRWSGVGAFVLVIPVPILMPIGHQETRIYIREGFTVGSVSQHGGITGGLGPVCGSNECAFLAGPVDRDHQRKAEVPWCD